MKRSIIADLRHEIFLAREKAVANFQAAQLEQNEFLRGSDSWNEFFLVRDDYSQQLEIADNAVDSILQLETCLRHLNLLED